MENAIGDEVFILPRRRYKNRSRDVELKPGLDDLVNQDNGAKQVPDDCLRLSIRNKREL